MDCQCNILLKIVTKIGKLPFLYDKENHAFVAPGAVTSHNGPIFLHSNVPRTQVLAPATPLSVQKLPVAAIFPHINALLAHMFHARCTPSVYYVRQQGNFHSPVCRSAVQRIAPTHRVCMRYTVRVVYIVSATAGALCTFSVHFKFTHRCTVYLQ